MKEQDEMTRGEDKAMLSIWYMWEAAIRCRIRTSGVQAGVARDRRV